MDRVTGWRLRHATGADVHEMHGLIVRSVRALSRGYYSEAQIESSIRHVFGVDSQLLADATYYVAEKIGEGTILGCGGWSRRRTLFGGDQMKAAADPLLDPATDRARVRAFFVDPAWSRQGIGSDLIQACMSAARQAGFKAMELAATLPGEPLYRRWGFEVVERFDQTLPDGVIVPFVRMQRVLYGEETG